MDAFPKAGTVIYLGPPASVQFTKYPILLRVVRVQPWETVDGWAWIQGYQLDDRGDAVELRSVYVQLAGCELADDVIRRHLRSAAVVVGRRGPVPVQPPDQVSDGLLLRP